MVCGIRYVVCVPLYGSFPEQKGRDFIIKN